MGYRGDEDCVSWRSFGSVLGLVLLMVLPAQAERRSWVCEFPNLSNQFISPKITLTYDAQADSTMVIDELIEAMVGSPVKAKVGQRRAGPQTYEWRLQGWSRTELFINWLRYRLKVQPDGQAYVDASNDAKQFSARGRCK
ncbi:MAG: hypothetical protein ACRC14_03920 [Paracoccaceae bacterium]